MRWMKRSFWVVMVLLGLAVAAAAVYVQRSLPQISGTLQLAGLKAAVQVQRDASDVTHIQSKYPQDAWMALGYVHAQERG